jgi:hypothetical protein
MTDGSLDLLTASKSIGIGVEETATAILFSEIEEISFLKMNNLWCVHITI